MNLLEWLQNLKQHSRPIGALCGKKFDYESQPFGRYGFPRVLQFFDTRTVHLTAEKCIDLNKFKVDKQVIRKFPFYLALSQNWPLYTV